ncbi:hypothetical protein OMP38_17820 [Cohnella ginsengisoli]|uniref:Uncharacterized protein n=1 Tax=Cohnella ginsengisoli TaxID=425004 RepID=A0A9X4KIC0_9BACL|nr:hypothetical protein [Cohnella ginsengisoli]MDG0792523.1 hypothetical protein [Cohnella ginsengisoli]
MIRTVRTQLGRFSIRRQVILLFFLIVVLPFLFIGYFAYSKSIKAIQDVSSFVSMEMMVKNAKVLDNYLDLVDNAQSEIMYSQDMQELLSIRPSGGAGGAGDHVQARTVYQLAEQKHACVHDPDLPDRAVALSDLYAHDLPGRRYREPGLVPSGQGDEVSLLAAVPAAGQSDPL